MIEVDVASLYLWSSHTKDEMMEGSLLIQRRSGRMSFNKMLFFPSVTEYSTSMKRYVVITN